MYKCICGKEFKEPNSFNGHKSNCFIHLKNENKLDNFLRRKKIYIENLQNHNAKCLEEAKERKEKELQQWISEKHTCEKCGKVMTEKFGSGRFCSRSCANSRVITEETKNKISQSVQRSYDSINITNIIVKKRQQSEKEYYLNPKHCICCGEVIPFEKRNKRTCGNLECIKSLQVDGSKKGGKISAQKRVLRSKNEIYFCELCEKYFKNVRHNEPIFNGWDADIIIDDIKYAILWNGAWHYKQLVKGQHLLQIQTRDKIKLNEIIKCNYTPYVIEDKGKFDRFFVEEQFNLFIDKLE